MRSDPAPDFLGHPRGLYLLFATEMWERFSYYGMRALLVLSLVAGTHAADPGFGWDSARALRLYGTYTALAYLTPLIGGWLADRYLGQRLSVLIGGVVMMLGQFTLAASVGRHLALFYAGLGLLVVGNGFFKANISTMVGALYAKGDARRDGGFTIFYMGINLGAFLAPLVCSTLGESAAFGWRFGYAAAGWGMGLAVVIQLLLARALLGEVGLRPAARRGAAARDADVKLTRIERDRLRVMFVLFAFVVLFWAAFEQAGGLMTLYAAAKTDRFLTATIEVPAGYFQSLNPLFIILLAPLFAALWRRLAAGEGGNPPAPVKMIFGLLLTAVGFAFMVGAVFDQRAHGQASMLWLVAAYFFHTCGELCISPVGLSMTTKLAPPRLAGVMMGVWFLINFVANYLAGMIGALAQNLGDLAIFAGIAVALAVFAAALWTLSGRLVAWMHGAEATVAMDSAA